MKKSSFSRRLLPLSQVLLLLPIVFAMVANLLMPLKPVLADGDASTVITSSNDIANITSEYFSLSDYFNVTYVKGLPFTSLTQWPTQAGISCPSGSSAYTTAPWLPENDRIDGSNGGTDFLTSGSRKPNRGYDGNTLGTNGNCANRYVDGGGNGAWMNTGPYVDGGWADTPGSNGFFGPVHNVTTGSFLSSGGLCSNLWGVGAPVLWGSSGPNAIEQAYNHIVNGVSYTGLMAKHGSSSTTQPSNSPGLYSNGTTLFRDQFTLTNDQYAAMQSGDTVQLYASADDWLHVYLNGNDLGQTKNTKGFTSATIQTSYFNPAGTANVLAFQVDDKAIWQVTDTPSSRQSGLCFNLALNSTPQHDVCTNIAGTQTVVPTGYTAVGGICTSSGGTGGGGSGGGSGGGGSGGGTCSVTAPSSVEAGQSFYVTAGVTYGSPADAQSVLDNGGFPFFYMDGNSGAYWMPGFNVTPSGSTISYVFYDLISSSGVHTITGGVMDSSVTGDNSSCSIPITVSAPVTNYYPYVNFFNSDVAAGGAFATEADPQCSSLPMATGKIAANVSPSSGLPVKGSGAQFGSIALGDATNFISADLRSSNPVSPYGLTFANSGTKGNLGSQRCIPNYYGGLPTTGTQSIAGSTFSITPSSSGIYSHTGDLTIPAGSVANGTAVTIYVNGNVTINGNVKFANTSWSSLSDIPSLYIIAEGNISIGPNVTELDGTYIAQGSDGKGGTINTCSVSLSSDVYSQCQNQLTVYGSFIAGTINLYRTFSTTDSAVVGEHPNPTNTPGSCVPGRTDTSYDCAAEVFLFSPANYLSHPALPPLGGDQGAVKFDSISSLSPVL